MLMFCPVAPNERNAGAGSPRDKSPRSRPPVSGSGVGNGDFRAALKPLLLVATLAVQAAACAGGEPTREEAASEDATATSAVVAAGDAPRRCADAGVPERESAAAGPPADGPDARTRTRQSCTVQLTRRGDPLTIEYQIK
jgi:hypothetical protein